MTKNIHRVTFKLQGKIKGDMSDAIKNEGYGKRGKAKWISEAIENLVDNVDFLELMAVGLDEPSDLLADADGIFLNEEVRRKLDNALVRLRREYPQYNINQSAVVRTAIFQRLIRRQI